MSGIKLLGNEASVGHFLTSDLFVPYVCYKD